MGVKVLFYWYVILSGSIESDINLDILILMFLIFFNGLVIWFVNFIVYYFIVIVNKIMVNWVIVVDCFIRNEEDWLKIE